MMFNEQGQATTPSRYVRVGAHLFTVPCPACFRTDTCIHSLASEKQGGCGGAVEQCQPYQLFVCQNCGPVGSDKWR